MKTIDFFNGTPEEAGYRYAELLLPRIERLNMLKDEQCGRLKNNKKNAYLKKYRDIVEKFAPHWIPELEKMAETWKWKLDEMLLFTSLRYAPPFSDDCTSWIVMPELSRDGQLMLHKNRDGGNNYQSFMIKKINDHHKWIGLGDIGNHSPIFAVNEKGMALVVNNGEPCTENREAGLTTPDILRLLAENCENASQAVTLYEKVISSGAYAHGKSGSILLIADPASAYIIENTAMRLVSTELKFGFEVRSNCWYLPGMSAYVGNISMEDRLSNETRYTFVRDSLRQLLKKNKLAISQFRTISRAQNNIEKNFKLSVYKESTSSAVSILPDKEFPEYLTGISVAIGPPGTTYYVPFCTGVDKMALEMVDSSWSLCSYEIRDKTGLNAERELDLTAKETELHARHGKAVNEARTYLRANKIRKAKDILNENFLKNSEIAFEWLRKSKSII